MTIFRRTDCPFQDRAVWLRATSGNRVCIGGPGVGCLEALLDGTEVAFRGKCEGPVNYGAFLLISPAMVAAFLGIDVVEKGNELKVRAVREENQLVCREPISVVSA